MEPHWIEVVPLDDPEVLVPLDPDVLVPLDPDVLVPDTPELVLVDVLDGRPLDVLVVDDEDVCVLLCLVTPSSPNSPRLPEPPVQATTSPTEMEVTATLTMTLRDRESMV